jgi:hypothetical protein
MSSSDRKIPRSIKSKEKFENLQKLDVVHI